MTAAARQIPLPLPVRTALGEADFLVTDSNREAVAWLDSWPDWPGQGLLLQGPPASGKSHLLTIWAKRANASVLTGGSLTMESAVCASGPVAVDGADQCHNINLLFHLINQVRASGGTLLLATERSSGEWAGRLPDLQSRLAALPLATLAAPNDELLAGLAAKLFHDRQIVVPDAVIAYMLTRLERSCAAVAAAVEKLDQAAWAERRALTLPLARRILDPETPNPHRQPD